MKGDVKSGYLLGEDKIGWSLKKKKEMIEWKKRSSVLATE